jgi:hypothetical protein
MFRQELMTTTKRAFRVKRAYRKILRNRKARIQRRLARKNFSDQPQPMLRGGNVHYEMGERSGAVGCGGLGAIHTMVQRLGLVQDLDAHLQLLKVHLPYHESDHVLNIAYNILAGGIRLEDIEVRRQDENFLNGLGAARLPDPTTAGDFTRRFNPQDILALQQSINRTRAKVWQEQPEGFLAEAFIDVDGTMASTYGQCKAGIGLSYNGVWGYHPLVVSLANTKEVLYLVNRPANVTSHQDSVEWIDRAIELVRPHAGTITVRGDTDFTHTAQVDRWHEQGIRFILGMDAHPKVVELAKALPASAWRPLERPPKYEIQTEPRTKPHRVKEQIIRQKGYQNIVLVGEEVAQMDYQPLKCDRTHRLVVVRKNLSVQRGERELFEDVRYFFYLTNRGDLTAAQVVELANGRCDQENVIQQLKNGVNAMRMPVDDLNSNWAYMVMAALAWNLKAWFALLVPERAAGLELLEMEFRRFLQAIVQLPCQIVRTSRRLIWRILSYNRWLGDFFATFERIVALGQT